MSKEPLNAEEQKKFDADVDAYKAKLMREVRPDPPAPDGNAHWLTSPHGAADVFSPHHVQTVKEERIPVVETIPTSGVPVASVDENVFRAMWEKFKGTVPLT